MGAWGTGVFDNDSALDWVWELEAVSGTDLLQATFDTVNEAQYREATDCSEALAAAEVVAALLGNPSDSLPNEIVEWLAKNQTAVDTRLQASAWTAVDHILVDSELRELWSESVDFDAWQNLLQELMHRLAPPTS